MYADAQPDGDDARTTLVWLISSSSDVLNEMASLMLSLGEASDMALTHVAGIRAGRVD